MAAQCFDRPGKTRLPVDSGKAAAQPDRIVRFINTYHFDATVRVGVPSGIDDAGMTDLEQIHLRPAERLELATYVVIRGIAGHGADLFADQWQRPVGVDTARWQ